MILNNNGMFYGKMGGSTVHLHELKFPLGGTRSNVVGYFCTLKWTIAMVVSWQFLCVLFLVSVSEAMDVGNGFVLPNVLFTHIVWVK